MANLAIKHNDIPFDDITQVEIKTRPSFPDNIKSWQVFDDDKDLLKFLFCENQYEHQWIDWNGLVEDKDGKGTVLGQEVLQLKTNKIPKGLIELERMFDDKDIASFKSNSGGCEDVEKINLGSESNPREVYIGKRLIPKIITVLINLLRKYKNVFAWSYDDLKEYREDLLQHEIPLKPDAKPFK